MVIIFFDSLFDPIFLIAEEGGPTKIILFFSHLSAKSAFSDKNPNPGWIASALDSLAI